MIRYQKPRHKDHIKFRNFAIFSSVQSPPFLENHAVHITCPMFFEVQSNTYICNLSLSLDLCSARGEIISPSAIYIYLPYVDINIVNDRIDGLGFI